MKDIDILANGAYVTDEIPFYIVQQNGDDAIPPKNNPKDPRSVNWHLYERTSSGCVPFQ